MQRRALRSLSLSTSRGFDCMKKPCASSHCVAIFVLHFWHFQLYVTESPVFDVFIAQVLFNDYLMIMIFQSRIGIRKKKKGNKYPPQKMCSSLTYFLQLIYIFFIFFFSGISVALRGHRFGGTPETEKPRRQRHQCWRVAEMMHLKIWWWEIGSCIAAALECSGRNSNFFSLYNSKPIKLNDHCNFMIGKIAERPSSTARAPEMDRFFLPHHSVMGK